MRGQLEKRATRPIGTFIVYSLENLSQRVILCESSKKVVKLLARLDRPILDVTRRFRLLILSLRQTRITREIAMLSRGIARVRY